MPPLQTQFPITFITRNSGQSNEINMTAPTITPTLGAELLNNGGFETAGAGGADVFANWTEAVSGTSIINSEPSDVHGGDHACRIDVDASNSSASVRQVGLSAQRWFQFSAWAKTNSGTPRAAIGTSLNLFKPQLSTSWAQYSGAQRTASGTEAFFYRSDGSASKSIYFDDVSAKEIVFASAHTQLGIRTTRNGTYTCHPNVAEFWQAGMLVGYADDNNFVMIFVDRLGDLVRAKLVKCIGGSYSAELITAEVTYSAGKALALMVNGDQYSLFYDNVQVGTTQTISGTSLGLEVHAFSTSALNTVGLVTTTPQLFITAPLAMSAAEFRAIATTDDDFTVIYLPDTQIYSRDASAFYSDQTQWIVDNAAALNVQMVLHEGDVVDGVTQAQFNVAVAAHAILQNADIPNLISPGNHDYTATNPNGRDLTLFKANFPATYWTETGWFNGEMYADDYVNMYVTRTVGSKQYVFVALEYNPRDAVLDWLDDVLTAHASKTAIIVEHIYLLANDTLFNEGRRLFDRLKYHANVLLVGSGHHVTGTDYVGDRSDWLANGQRLFAFMANFQNEPTTGGLGYLRIITIKPNSRAMLIQTYSPSLDNYLTGADEEFVWVW